ncbi:hypothetical protein [Pelagicoccus sp. SDUM812002]|uniref:hypothetical protein n=1 Tax=Pelagicoccus sp. SDUM812002 TaxID=3041266 RepID=UPI00280CAEDB|nr:hypothetical protein [Pelagicoccus sp. SDUM812002]MDQ8185787.1 hypothetical protein [Pelagicoccus sp. SDUM812002]
MKSLLKLLLPLSLVSGLMAEVETFYADAKVGASQGSTVLEAGKGYRIVISGTWSKWADQNVCGGTPEDTVRFPSEDTENGKAYMDPAFIFAYPVKSSFCSDVEHDLPVPSSLLYWNGTDWVAFNPSLNEYRNDHTYEYIVEGIGEALQLRFPDNLLEDNYGQLKIEIFESPSIGVSYYTHNKVKLDFLGVLQASEDGEEWTDLSPQPESPIVISAEEKESNTGSLYRVRRP